MSRIVALAGLFFLMVAMAQFWPASARADDAANVASYRKFVDSINKGDVAGALALFTDDASLSGVRPNCVPSACVGRAAIQNQLQTEVNAIHLQLQLIGSVNVVNGNVVAQVAHRNDPIRQQGLSRVVVTETVTFSGNSISKFVVEPQTTDPQTAAFLRALSQPPAPAAPVPAAPVAVVPPTISITAPSTGDGGLLHRGRGTSPLLKLLVILPVVAVMGVTSRRGTAG